MNFQRCKIFCKLWKKHHRNPPPSLRSLDSTECSRAAKRQLLCLSNRYWVGWEPELVNMRLSHLSREGCTYSVFLVRQPVADSPYNATCPCPSFKPHPWDLSQLLIHEISVSSSSTSKHSPLNSRRSLTERVTHPALSPLPVLSKEYSSTPTAQS